LVSLFPKNKTFTHLIPVVYKHTFDLDTNNRNHKIIINNIFYEYNLPNHPHIYVTCSFCSSLIHSINIKYYIEHPQARRRLNILCESCYKNM
jgi:hypothetical protein